MYKPRNCTHCGTSLKELHNVDTRGLDGIEHAQAGNCDHCGGITLTRLQGQETAMALARIVMETPPRYRARDLASC